MYLRTCVLDPMPTQDGQTAQGLGFMAAAYHQGIVGSVPLLDQVFHHVLILCSCSSLTALQQGFCLQPCLRQLPLQLPLPVPRRHQLFLNRHHNLVR